MLDVFPILRKLPPFLRPNFRYAQELHRKESSLYVGHWMNTKKQLLEGKGKVRVPCLCDNEKAYSPSSKPCFSNDILKEQEKEEFTDLEAGYLTGSFLEAGSDTTAATLLAFVQAMLVFPDVQEKAKEEIDRVVGPDRLPTMEDEPKLQYIRACIKETFRWMPTAIMGIPHGLLQDDTYMSYKIPAGAAVINNVWSVKSQSTKEVMLN